LKRTPGCSAGRAVVTREGCKLSEGNGYVEVSRKRSSGGKFIHEAGKTS